MDEQINEPENTDGAEQKSSSYIIPGAIILAGAMVAAAVMYGGPSKAPAPTAENQPQNPPAAAGAALSDELKTFINVKAGDYVLGNPVAPVTIAEFGDFECPFCAQFHTNTRPQLIDKYVKTGQVKLIWRHFPLVQIHANAEPASLASECAGEQGKFWEYHDLLFETKKLDGASLMAHAQILGLNMDSFRSCFDSGKYLEKVRNEFELGRQAGVSGTPSFFINGELVVGAVPFASIEPIILKALNN